MILNVKSCEAETILRCLNEGVKEEQEQEQELIRKVEIAIERSKAQEASAIEAKKLYAETAKQIISVAKKQQFAEEAENLQKRRAAEVEKLFANIARE